jgi:methylthioribose-1-phosphate isomerase
MTEFYSLRWDGDHLRLLDQRVLPEEICYVDLCTCADVARAIADMVVRGAPAIGAAAAYGLALEARAGTDVAALERAGQALIAVRPTAVNLRWAVQRVLVAANAYRAGGGDIGQLPAIVLAEADAIAQEDREVNRRLSQLGAALLPDGANVIHHCNTGALATVAQGTALGIIRAAHDAGKRIHVYVDETRPRLQGARLTAWELAQAGIPHTVIVDGAAAHLMRVRPIDAVLVGCDRVARNGDVANKIGTYQLALAAHAHAVPFYVAAPLSTIDRATLSGEQIAVEERDPDEVRRVAGERLMPAGVPVWNPAFDVTPAEFVTAFVTERGVVQPPYEGSLAQL